MTNERARAFYKQCGFVEEAVLLEMNTGINIFEIV
jgi:hypothetical protein